MLRILAVAVAIPTMFAAWAGPRISHAAQEPLTADAAPSPGDAKVTGCVARATEAGPSLTSAPAGAAREPLLLTKAIIAQPEVERAAPGAAGAGGNSGTIGRESAPVPNNATRQELSFELTGEAQKLREHVGKRVEVTGAVSAAPAGSGAHTSSPRGQLKVRSFRAVGGGCPLG